MTPRLTLLTGGVRSGKSARALSLARERADAKPVLFVATAQAFDDEMRARIDAHKAERTADWETLEEPTDVARQLRAYVVRNPHRHNVVVIDCLTLWVSNLLLSLSEDANAESIIDTHARELLAVLDSPEGPRTIVVTNEVGSGVVPPTALGRRYRDALGRVNQLVAAAADEVILMVSGIDVVIKPRG